MNGFIYLIYSNKFDKHYLGSTSDPNTRISLHNSGNTKSTKDYRPWVCKLIINVGSIEEARKIEKYIKSYKEKLNIHNVIRALNKYYEKKQSSACPGTPG